jgi:hypothetical protein
MKGCVTNQGGKVDTPVNLFARKLMKCKAIKHDKTEEFIKIISECVNIERELLERTFNYAQIDLGMEADEFIELTFNDRI